MVNGKGIEQLQKAGVKVITGVLEKKCISLNKRFFTFHRKKRPYVILKWAQTKDGKISSTENSRLFITNEATNRFVHKWRSEEAGIVVGTNTALADDPALTNRLWPGESPVRIIVDMELRLPPSLKVFDQKIPTIVFNTMQHDEKENITWWQVNSNGSLVQQMMSALFELKIQSIIVEGGAILLQSFIDEEAWDEARVITNTRMIAGKGTPAPSLMKSIKQTETMIIGDSAVTYLPETHNT